MIVVREVSPDEWETLRDIRLAALRDAPQAFASTYAREAAFTREQWRGRFSTWSVTFFACLPDIAEPAGLAGLSLADGMADLVSMWVRPAARGHQVGESLVTAAAGWAKAHDYDALFLWVTESNEPARGLYQRCGFAPAGERQPLPSDPALTEIRMRRPLLRREPVGPAEQERRVADRVQSECRHQQAAEAQAEAAVRRAAVAEAVQVVPQRLGGDLQATQLTGSRCPRRTGGVSARCR